MEWSVKKEKRVGRRVWTKFEKVEVNVGGKYDGD